MGWTESPPFSCATTETARDIAEELINNNISVQPHSLEHLCCPPKHWTKIKDHGTICENFISQLEVYVDDFIMMTQVLSSKELLRFSRSLLHAIHMVFLPSIITKHDRKDPISVKKLEQGDGLWKYRKTVLGWIFDGLSRCLSLPKERVEEIMLEGKAVGREKHIPLLRFQKNVGKLRHAAICIPSGKGFFIPLHDALRDGKEIISVTKILRHTYRDWRILLRLASKSYACKTISSSQTTIYW